MAPPLLRRNFLKTAGTGLGAAALVSPIPGQSHDGQSRAPSNYDVRNFGAKGDGKSLDTEAINATIAAASSAGGGTVHLPAGTYLCYSIHLKSNVTLDLSPGATILAADPTDIGGPGTYDAAESNAPWEAYQDFGHNHWHNSLIWGEGLDNVAIVGRGLIWGKGLSRGWGNGPVAEHPGVGNKAIALKNCRNVLLRDFSILHGGHFGILATGVDNFTLDNLKIDTNRDGVDIDCCRNVHITDCSVNSPWDDGICLKSSFALGFARTTERVTISNCILSGSFEEGTMLDASYKRFGADTTVPRTGRIKFGTESNGGFKNITVSNCVFDGCHGLAIESVDGAVIEDVCVENITMRDLIAAPLFVRLGARMRGPTGATVGSIRRLIVSNLTCQQAAVPLVSSIIAGIPGHSIEDVKLSDISLLHQGGGTEEDGARELPEKDKDYPEPTMFGATPSSGFFVRHAKGIEVSGLKLEAASPDARPAFVLEDVQGADFRFLKLTASRPGQVFALKNVSDLSVFRSNPVPDTELDQVKETRL